jgi:NADH-quinone oxidoreductase subunit C
VDGERILARLRERFGPAVLEAGSPFGQYTAVVDRGVLREALGVCKADPDLAFDMLVDLTAVDYLKFPGREDGPRFEVVYHLYSLPHNQRLRLKVRVEEDGAVVPSATPLWPIANWLEREVWDMFGIRFEGHPDLRRLLMYEEFEGHPLRKDYPIQRRQPLIGPRN